MDRRELLVAGSAAVCAGLAPAFGAPPTGAVRVGFERGDPAATADPAYFDQPLIDTLVNDAQKKVIPDPIADFPQRLVERAVTYEGVNRFDQSWTKIRDMLAVFGCPFEHDNGKRVYTAFCAAGIGYCACSLYAKSSQLKDLQAMIGVVDFHNCWPSSAVWRMAQVANSKGRWKAAGAGVVPKPGWIVCFDWSGGVQKDAVDHCGVVVSADAVLIHTLEFNTSGNAAGSQRDGGVVAKRDRHYNSVVKGFIVTDTMDT